MISHPISVGGPIWSRTINRFSRFPQTMPCEFLQRSFNTGSAIINSGSAKSFVSCDEEASHGTIAFWIVNLDFDKVVHLRDQPLRNQHIKVVHSWDHRLRNHLQSVARRPLMEPSLWDRQLDRDKVVHLRDQPLWNQHIKVVHSWDHRLRNHLQSVTRRPLMEPPLLGSPIWTVTRWST